jgi:molecular chaperone GrpE (heat shock protein)
MNYQDDLLKATDLIFKAKKEANNIYDTNIRLRDEIKMLKDSHKDCRESYTKAQAELDNEKRKSDLAISIAIICFIFAAVCLGLLILE